MWHGRRPNSHRRRPMTRNDFFPPGDATNQLLSAIPAGQRGRARTLLTDPRCGGRGLRALVALLDTDPRALPDALPAELVEVYLRDDEAEPLHDCERCGLPVPVHAG